MKDYITYSILDKIGDVFVETPAFLTALVKSGYGASFAQIQKEFSDQLEESVSKKQLRNESEKLRLTMHYLKKDGLIESQSREGISFIRITAKGEKRLALFKIKTKLNYANPYKQNIPDKIKTDSVNIVIFDIPEKDRWKRSWIGCALLNIGLQRVQKSVWIGKVKITEQFIDDLKLLNLIEKVEIFSVNKYGTLRNIDLNS